jgi:hypothetical protein
MNESYIVMIAICLAFAALYWAERNGRKYGEPDEESGSDDDNGGGGGKWDKPKGRPPSGPDRDIDTQFHAVADAIGKTIQIEEKDKDKVLL